MATVRFLLSGRLLAVAAPLSLMAWMAQAVSLCWIVQALGYELAASTVIAIYCLSILAGATSFIPGGLGATEAAIVLLLSAAGVGPTDAITASLVSRSLTLRSPSFCARMPGLLSDPCYGISVPLTDGQFDALVSFTFNLSAGALQRSTLRRKVNRGEHDEVPAELMKWAWAAGKLLPSLVRRRKTEAWAYSSEHIANATMRKGDAEGMQKG